MENCKNCEYYYKEHCANGYSEYCTEPVMEDYSCHYWELKSNGSK